MCLIFFNYTTVQRNYTVIDLWLEKVINSWLEFFDNLMLACRRLMWQIFYRSLSLFIKINGFVMQSIWLVSVLGQYCSFMISLHHFEYWNVTLQNKRFPATHHHHLHSINLLLFCLAVICSVSLNL